jgi:MoaA/NifB/PqqE/SkfB family radical SAM enzyme
MSNDKGKWITVQPDGSLIIPPELSQEMGFKPGARMRVDSQGNHLRLHRSSSHLAKVYIEPTNLCNLDCLMCIRSGWEEKLGRMSQESFNHILEGLRAMDPKPTVFFGGLGEPLFHPHTVDWIGEVKKLGCQVELITNGTPLTEKRARQLIANKLDVLWVSIDGSTPEHYADIRLGAELPKILDNIDRFRRMRPVTHNPKPQLGIAFVAMRRNINDLPTLLKLARQLGAMLFSVSNLMPYTKEMQDDRLYAGTLKNIAYFGSPWLPRLSLPKMDINEITKEAFVQAVNSGYQVNYAGNSFGNANDVCNFIESGSMSIAWDGNASPCWPLMHTHTSYLHGKIRSSRRHIIGNVRQHTLFELWNDPAYTEYREKVQGFKFSPCTFCGGCEMSEANEEDCLGNEFPACGSCLWSQGVIQCP